MAKGNLNANKTHEGRSRRKANGEWREAVPATNYAVVTPTKCLQLYQQTAAATANVSATVAGVAAASFSVAKS